MTDQISQLQLSYLKKMNVKYWCIVLGLTTASVITIICTRTRTKRIITQPRPSLFSNEDLNEYFFHSKFKNINNDISQTYDCVDGTCKRSLYSTGKRTSLKTCNMMCGFPQLWPYPKTIEFKNKSVSAICVDKFRLTHNTSGNVWYMLSKAYKYMHNNIQRQTDTTLKDCKINSVDINVRIRANDHTLLLNTSEEYNLTISHNKERINVTLIADTYFGARHGLETLYQLIWWDEVEHSFLLMSTLHISDAPAYTYRGLMLDTGNNYFSVKSILKTLMGMSANKLNVFHWHITDFASFPFQAPSYPYLSKYGAYDETRIYTPKDIKKIVNFAKYLGIRVIMEIDAPGHMLAGWEAMEGDLVVLKKESVTGEMNPMKKEVFQILQKLYEDIINLTEEEEIFHIGGHTCEETTVQSLRTNSSKTIQTMYDYLKKLNRTKYTLLWSSEFTNSKSFSNLDPSTIIIQVTNEKFLPGYYKFGVIYSQDDYWSLGCGLGFWTPLKFDPCYEYKSWQEIYQYAPWFENEIEIVYGGELLLWSQQVGEDTLDNILWPRAAAFAEAVWKAEGFYDIPENVPTRLDTQRERLEYIGLDSSVMWPEWCTLNPNMC